MRTAKELVDKEIRKITQDVVRAHVRGEMEALIEGNADTELLIVMEHEIDGGQCPRCDKYWKKIEVKNALADFHYFVPSCNCYTKCTRGRSYAYRGVRKRRDGDIRIEQKLTNRYVESGCGASKHREDILGITRCLSCGYDPAAEAKQKDKTESATIDQYKKTMGVG